MQSADVSRIRAGGDGHACILEFFQIWQRDRVRFPDAIERGLGIG